MFKGGRGREPPWSTNFCHLWKDISTEKAIDDEDAKYTLEEISAISNLSASYVFSI